MPFGPRLKAIQNRLANGKAGRVSGRDLPPGIKHQTSIIMDTQQRLRQTEQSNIRKAFIDYDARLQQAFANAKNPKPIDWVRTPHGWSISRDR